VSEECKNPSFYFNWKQNRKSVLDASTAWTPAVNLFVALDTSLQMMKEEGIENIWKRHARIATAIRAGVKAIGLELLVKDERVASNAITAVLPPTGITVPDIRKTIKNDFDIVVANGQKELKDKIFRIGNLGYVSDRDAITAIGSLEATLYKLGYEFKLGTGVAAVIEALRKEA
jgi:aspartate aminotransferase-like enzyme